MSKIFGLFTCFSSKKSKPQNGEEAKRPIKDNSRQPSSGTKNARILPHVGAGDQVSGKAACSKCGNAVAEGGRDSDLGGKRSNSINGIKPQLSKDDSNAQTEYLTVSGQPTSAGGPGQGRSHSTHSIAEGAAATLTINEVDSGKKLIS